jgi:hypothetical protein
MSPFLRIDNFFFDRIFQPLVNRFPNAGPAGVARFFITGDMMSRLMCRMTTYPREYGWMVVDIMLMVYFYLTADRPRARLGARNIRRTKDQIWRAIFWAVTVLDTASVDLSARSLLELADSVLFLAFFYAVACDKLPPRRAKARVWDRMLGMARPAA